MSHGPVECIVLQQRIDEVEAAYPLFLPKCCLDSGKQRDQHTIVGVGCYGRASRLLHPRWPIPAGKLGLNATVGLARVGAQS